MMPALAYITVPLTVVTAGLHRGVPWELVASIPVLTYAQGTPPSPVRIAHVLIPDCTAGQVLQCTSVLAVTNDTPRSIEVATGSILSPSPTGTGGYPLSRVRGFNLDFARHHDSRHDMATIEVPHGGDWYYAVIGYAGGDASTQSGDVLKIDPYGEATVTRWG